MPFLSFADIGSGGLPAGASASSPVLRTKSAGPKAAATGMKRAHRCRGFSLVEMLVTVLILTVVLAVVGQTVVQVQQNYVRTRAAVESQNNARSALDLMTRLVRQAGHNPRNIAGLQALTVADTAAPTGQLDRIRIQADWNPPDGDILDPYEDVQFTLNPAAAQLSIRDGAAGPALPFVEGIQQLELQCFDANGFAIPAATAATPAGAGAIVSVDFLLTTGAPGGPPLVFRSSATVRGRE